MSTMRAVQTRPAPSDGWRRWLPVALLGATLALGLWAVSPRAAMARPEESPPAELAAKAKTILETHCVRCHGVKDEVGTKMDVRKLATLTRGTDGGPGVVVPGDPAASYLMLRVDPKTAGENGGSMPPEGESPRPSEADVETLRAWIAAGAPSWGGAEPAPAAPAAPAPTLDQQAHAILKAHCAGCHGASRREKNLNFLEPRSFRRVLRGGALSPLVKRVTADAGAAERMPPAPRPALGAADQDVLRRWAAEERREDVVAARIEDVLRLVRDDLHALAREQREHMRYVSMLHDLADPDLSDEDRAASRAAVSKLLNSLSWSARVSVPRVLGTGRHLGLVLAVDTRTLDGRPPWGAAVYFRDVWDQVLASSDPYALRRESQYVADAAVGRLAEDIHDLSGDHNPVVRGDWLVARAGRSPLYYAALQLPPSVEQLERQLGADVSGGLSRAAEGHATDEVVRSGFRSSGVSRYNRIVERHALSRGGSYWKSFDFRAPELERRDALRFPLGPRQAGLDPSGRHAFEEDGGEMIFSLPNGLHGYFLADARGGRIDVGPTDVVFHSGTPLGYVEIGAGVSCMVCHYDGMLPLTDEVRVGSPLGGRLRQIVDRLYVPDAQMKARHLDPDREQYRRALGSAVRPLLLPSQHPKSPDDPWLEVAGPVAARYNEPLTLTTALRELDLTGVGEAALRTIADASPDARVILLPLLAGGTVGREQWESLTAPGNASQFQVLSRLFRRGVPYRRL